MNKRPAILCKRLMRVSSSGRHLQLRDNPMWAWTAALHKAWQYV